jgi:phage gpG-like protein
MTLQNLEQYFATLPDKILPDAAHIVAETATEYFKQSFTRKGFDGNPWAAARTPKKRGSLLIDSGALMNSIRPLEVSKSRVVIAAGNAKVTYARVHNEGFNGTVSVPAHIRKTKKGSVSVTAHTRTAHIIQRQFLGDAEELNKKIKERLVGYINSVTSH